MHFSNTEKGKRELNKSREIYANHKKLVMVAREEVSYQTMKKEFYENNVIKTPDIVTYLNKNGIDQKRDGALLILRSDIEANLDDEKIRQIEQTTLKYFKDVVYDDTAKGPGILSKYREEKIEEMLKKYRKCQLVITDRLHGMIFATITSTPCIALGNYNHKIKSCSETLEHLGYIKYVDNVEEIEENIKYLMSNEFEKYDNVRLYPGCKASEILDLFNTCDYFLDVNYENEIVDATKEAFLHNLLILGFNQTIHNRKYVLPNFVFDAHDYQDMVKVIQDASHLDLNLDRQRKMAMTQNVQDYRNI